VVLLVVKHRVITFANCFQRPETLTDVHAMVTPQAAILRMFAYASGWRCPEKAQNQSHRRDDVRREQLAVAIARDFVPPDVAVGSNGPVVSTGRAGRLVARKDSRSHLCDRTTEVQAAFELKLQLLVLRCSEQVSIGWRAFATSSRRK